MLIELKRIVSKKKKDKNGNFVKDPMNADKYLYRNEMSVESFDTSEIKRMRPWNRKFCFTKNGEIIFSTKKNITLRIVITSRC